MGTSSCGGGLYSCLCLYHIRNLSRYGYKPMDIIRYIHETQFIGYRNSLELQVSVCFCFCEHNLYKLSLSTVPKKQESQAANFLNYLARQKLIVVSEHSQAAFLHGANGKPNMMTFYPVICLQFQSSKEMAKEKPKTWMFQTVNCWAHRKPQFRIAQGPVATDNPPQMGTDSLQPDVVLIEAPCCGGITRHDLLGQIARSDTGASLGKDPDLPRLL